MNTLRVQDGSFVHPETGELLTAIQAVVVNSGTLSRSYYSGDQLACWSIGCSFPSEKAPFKQANRCLDCSRSIKNSHRAEGAPCKFFTFVRVALLGSDTVYRFRIGAWSLFSRDARGTTLYKYMDHLKRNKEEVGSVLTEIYFEGTDGNHKIYFKPVRPLSEEELQNTAKIIEAVANTTNEDEETLMSYKIKNAVAKYPRLDQPYAFDRSQGPRGRTVPCKWTASGAAYTTSFVVSEEQAKSIHMDMVKAWKNAPNRTKDWPERMATKNIQKTDEGAEFKAQKKAQYQGVQSERPAQFNAKNEMLEDGFQITSGSKINLLVNLYPWYNVEDKKGGVSLQIKGVQLIEFAPPKNKSPFDIEEGFAGGTKTSAQSEETEDNSVMFEDETVDKPTSVDNLFDDDGEEVEEIKEPVKRKKKKEEPEAAATEVADIIDIWGDD